GGEPMRDHWAQLVPVVCGLGMWTVLAPGANAAEPLTLHDALDAIARNVAGDLKEEQNAPQIVVNPITDRTDLTHNAGSGITEALIERLRAHGIEPALKAEFIFDGKYGAVPK